ncbi:putative hydrolase subunit [uncultured Desulfatiglans sp.]|uniref:Putative hydrolase subunit n=1 Tax=Uncultured Desulfatiglans sp. TaxID=1748965 RepID=A0A653AHF3_UNCDX|nr:putative hydrolase subunit [uncultured Desulfatiglans sp.]
MVGVLYETAQFRVSGDRGLLVEYGDGVDLSVNAKVRRMTALLQASLPDGVEAVIPAYRSLCILYDPCKSGPAVLKRHVLELEKLPDFAADETARTVKIPVCYGGVFGPDIAFVAAGHGLSEDEVILLHTARSYPIYAIGFAPGFCYLGGLDDRLHTPRLETPRTRVPAGSIGIAGDQTGAYPLEMPGGWRIIGRTPLRLFAPERTDPFVYRAGDRIRFFPISQEEFEAIAGGEQR